MACRILVPWSGIEPMSPVLGMQSLNYWNAREVLKYISILLKSTWSGVCVLSHSVMSSSLWPHGLQPARLLCSWGFSRQEYWSGLPCPPPGDLPNPGIEPRSPALQADSWPSELPGRSKNTRVGSLSLLQGNFLTQESNQGLLPCRQILYQLSYQGNPNVYKNG